VAEVAHSIVYRIIFIIGGSKVIVNNKMWWGLIFVDVGKWLAGVLKHSRWVTIREVF